MGYTKADSVRGGGGLSKKIKKYSCTNNTFTPLYKQNKEVPRKVLDLWTPLNVS